MERTGFVLVGGGMRGIYTAGVLDEMLDGGVRPDGILGVSAGAIHGASFVSGQQGRNIRYTKRYCCNWRFMSLRSLLVTGDLLGRAFSYEELPYRLDPFDFDAFLKSPVRFYALATDVETGQAVCLDGKRDAHTLLEALRASSSMPLVSTIVAWEGRRYLDGGVHSAQALRGHGLHALPRGAHAAGRLCQAAGPVACAHARALSPLSRLCQGQRTAA